MAIVRGARRVCRRVACRRRRELLGEALALLEAFYGPLSPELVGVLADLSDSQGSAKDQRRPPSRTRSRTTGWLSATLHGRFAWPVPRSRGNRE